MPKIKFDLRGTDPEKAKEGAFEDPKPGVYRALVKEMNAGFSKDDDGKPDKSRPRVEVVFEIIDHKYKGARLWLYLTFGDGYPAQKMDQFLQAFGIASKDKRTGEFNTDDIVNKACKIRVKGGTRADNSYRAEVGAVFADDGATNDVDDLFGADDADDNGSTDDGPFGGDDDAGSSDDATPWEVDADHIYTVAELEAIELPQVKEVAALYDDTTAYRSKEKAIAAVVAAQSAWCVDAGVEDPNASAEPSSDGAGDEGGGDDDDIILDDDEDMGGDDYLTKEQLDGQSVDEIKATAKQFDVVIKKGMKKSDVVKAILEAQAAPDDADDDGGETPF